MFIVFASPLRVSPVIGCSAGLIQTLLQTSDSQQPTVSRTLLCQMEGKPPWGQERECSTVKCVPQAQLVGGSNESDRKWLLHWFASYSIQYFGTYYTELRPRNVPVCKSIGVYGCICHICSTPMPESSGSVVRVSD